MKKYYAKKEGQIYSFTGKKTRDTFLANARTQFEYCQKDSCFYYLSCKKIPVRDYAGDNIKVIEIK